MEGDDDEETEGKICDFEAVGGGLVIAAVTAGIVLADGGYVVGRGLRGED